MSNDMTDARFYVRMTGSVMGCIRRDFFPILTVAIALGLIGLIAGMRSNYAVSTAQLLLTPLPLREATTQDNLAMMVAEPLDVISASRLCVSDEALRMTMEKLNETGEFPRELDDLNALRRALSYEVTIVKETPYETEYSPLLHLRARARTAAQAQLMVNTWSEVCVALAERYQERQQGLARHAFDVQKQHLLETLAEAEEEIETFLRENNPSYVKERLKKLVEMASDFIEDRAEVEQEMVDAESKFRALQALLDTQDPTVTLRWTPSGRLLDWAGSPLRPADADTNADAEESLDVLTQDELNPVYFNILGEVADTQSTVDGKRARLEALDRQLAEFAEEMFVLQAENARLQREDHRLERAAKIIEEAYREAAVKATFARMASDLNQPGLQLLTPGAEWRVPRFRRGITFGMAGAVMGFLAAAALSAGLRLVVMPALES